MENKKLYLKISKQEKIEILKKHKLFEQSSKILVGNKILKELSKVYGNDADKDTNKHH